MINNFKKGRAFTLIELIVVIAVLGILVLLAAPRFLGHTEDAKLVQIQNDLRVHEDMIEIERMHKEGFTANWQPVSTEEMEDYRDEGSLYNRGGKVSKNKVFDDEYLEIPDDVIESDPNEKLILANKGGEVYYHTDELNLTNNENGSDEYDEDGYDKDGFDRDGFDRDGYNEEGYNEEGFNREGYDKEGYNKDGYNEEGYNKDGFNREGYDKEGYNEEGYNEDGFNREGFDREGYNKDGFDRDGNSKGGFVWPPPGNYVLAKDANFSGTKDGSFKYTGADEYVIIPHVIKGVTVTSYYEMFNGTSVKGVASDNPNVTDMHGMFSGSRATTLDLSNFDTSSVTNMYGVFSGSHAITLDLRSFDTSNVTNMETMFSDNRATSLDLSSFDTSSVNYMTGMFRDSRATSLDLSSFDTSNVTGMGGMFAGSHATTLDLSTFDTSKVTYYMQDMFRSSHAKTGYARTQDDANKFNGSSNKPAGLTFTTK